MTSILLTKLFTPTTSASLVPRSRLLAKLNRGLSKPLTLVAAPAGFGKSTLIASWVASQNTYVPTWISLDKTENSIQSFFRYVLTALQTALPESGRPLFQQLQNSDTSDATPFVAQLINVLATSKQQTILVLDDYHVIEDAPIHAAVAFLLAHMPPQLHLVITTRVDPPFQLARLRARGQLTEIRAADLRFTSAEASTFLNSGMRLGLDEIQVGQLLQRTEGWIASLQLAALALQNAPQSRSAFLDSFAGSDRYIVDYLVSEVLSEVSAETRAFLFQTAHLDRFCAPLCDAVREADDSAARLQELERANLFLFPLDHQRYWYRYHHLFADLLQHRMGKAVDKRVLHQRASDWFASQGLVDEAIESAFSAENQPRAAQLIAQHAHPLFSNGKIEQVFQWVARLPVEWIRTQPTLFLLQGLMLYRFGRFADFFVHLDNVPDTTQLTDAQRGEWYALQAYAAYLQGDFQNAQRLCHDALTQLKNPMLKMPILTLLAWCYEAVGTVDTAIETLKKAAQLAEDNNSLTGILGSRGKLATLYAKQAAWEQVAAQHAKSFAVATKKHALQIPLFGLSYLAIGQWHHAHRETEAAIDALKQGIELCKRWGGLHIDVLRGYAALLKVLKEGGFSAEWQLTYTAAQAFATESQTPAWAHALLDVTNDGGTVTLPEPLTQREQDVLQWLAQGLNAPAVAKQMIVSTSTVRTHIKHIYAKLNVHNRAEALIKARSLRLIP